MKGTVFLVNPAAGSGKAAAVWQALLDSHPELRAATVVHDADRAVASGLLAGSLGDGARSLIVLGGDGTLHHAANALLAGGFASRVALGVVPAGTGSDLAHTLGIPDSPGAALQLALEAEPRPFDAIEVTREGRPTTYVVNTASAGVSGVVVDAVNRLARRSSATYLAATLRALAGYRGLRCRVAVDGESWYEGPILLLAVANGASFGKGMRVAPRARVDDGLADVVLVDDVPRWHLPLRLAQLYLGRHLGARPVRFRQARRVHFEPLEPFPSFELDGDASPAAAAELRVLPGALRVLRPAGPR